MTRLRITRSKRTKMDLDTITQSTQAVDITRVPNVQTRRASAQASASCQEESSPLATKLNLIWKTIKELKDNKGRTYSELFINLPDKELYPDYFGVIKNPIALNIIKQKIVDGKYLKEEDFEKDLDL
ncbi:2556_t:CDS:1, partial [Funneliformis mosseae]